MQRLGEMGFIAVSVALLAAVPAYADHLHVPTGAPVWMGIGAAAILCSLIGGGTVGMFSGAMALIVRKGDKLHRLSGNVLVVAMLIMSGIGAVVAPLFPDRISSVVGFMTFYLISTAWLTAQRREGVGPLEKFGLFVAIAGACATFFTFRGLRRRHRSTPRMAPRSRRFMCSAR